MSSDFSPTRVPGGGPRGRLALGVVGLSIVVVAGIGLLGGRVQPGEPSSTSSATPTAIAVASASPERTVRPTYFGPTPRPDPMCSERSIGPFSGPIPRHPRDLVPTGLETVVSWGNQGGGVVVDTDGQVWMSGAGRLERLDPTTGATTVWTFTDDPGFDAGGMKAAPGGGVWLFGGKQIRLFDGRRFADVIDVPSDVYDLAVAPDGTLWAATDQATMHWDGTSWTSLCEYSGGSYRAEVSGDGILWIVSNQSGTISRYDNVNGMWVLPIPGSAGQQGINGMTVAPDGSLWALDPNGLHRFGRAWETEEHQDVDLSGAYGIAATSDGSIWVAPATTAGTPTAGTGVGIARLLKSGVWQTFGAADGLVGRGGSDVTINGLTASGDTVYAATSDGLFRWDAAGWARIGDSQPPGPQPWAQRMVFDPAGDLWVSTDELWQLHAGDWIRTGISDVRDVTRNAHGALAVTTGLAVMVRRGGEWSTIDQDSVFTAAIGGDGRVWVVTGDPGSGQSLWSFEWTRGRWNQSSVRLPNGVTQVTTIAADDDGTLWIRGGSDTVESFWRLVKGRWGRLPALGEPTGPTWGRITIAPGGDLLAVLSLPNAGLVGRFHGSHWTIIGGDRPDQFEDGHDLGLAPDGTIWMATNGLATVRGSSMTLRYPGHWFGAVAIGPDHKVWVTGPSGIYRLDPSSPP